MFWFRHPKPFNRKEVAVQMVARAAAAPNTSSITVDTPGPDPLAPHAGLAAAAMPAGASGDAIEFSVRYRWSEFLHFVHQHVLQLIKTGHRFNPRRHIQASLVLAGLLASLACGAQALSWPGLVTWSAAGAILALAYAASSAGIGLKFQVAVFGTPAYAVKRYLMPECRFSIDAGGIRRESARVCLSLTWDDIDAVRTYRRGYLLLLERGALPIPFRCLSAGQASRLRALVLAHRAQRSMPMPA